MARFFLHVSGGDSVDIDACGIELDDVTAARREAILKARDTMADQLRAGLPVDTRLSVAITIGGDRVLDVVPFKLALTVM